MFTPDELRDRVYIGHALDILKEMPSNSVDMCITSPPYWGLRAYKTPPQIWDGSVECQHEWTTFTRKGMSGGTRSEKIHTHGTDNFQKFDAQEQCVCSKCGAWKGELGLEPDFNMYIRHLITIFNEVKRILKPTGTCWVNIADSYAGSGKGYGGRDHGKLGKHANDFLPLPNNTTVLDKSQIGIPERFAISMIDNGWIRRNTIIWWKPNAMPSSVKDRFTIDFEPLYFFVKCKHYYFEQQLELYQSVPQKPVDKSKQNCNNGYFTDRFSKGERDYYNQGGRNKRTVWAIPTKPYREAHFATFPEKLVETPIMAGCPVGGIVLDPFMGSGTTALVAKKLGRHYVGIELNEGYKKLIDQRLAVLEAGLC